LYIENIEEHLCIGVEDLKFVKLLAGARAILLFSALIASSFNEFILSTGLKILLNIIISLILIVYLILSAEQQFVAQVIFFYRT
jgi:hypothetical protein